MPAPSKSTTPEFTVVWCTTSFTGWHRWKNAPDEVAYLSEYHRHKFGVKAAVFVTHDNRQAEFHTLQTRVDAILGADYYMRHFEYSCEQLAAMIGSQLERLYGYKPAWVEVDEDSECGARVYWGIPEIARGDA